MPGFSQPFWLLGLGLLPVLWYFWRRANIRRKMDAIEFSQIAAVKSVQSGYAGKNRLFLLLFLPLLALGCLFIALADPHLPLGAEKEGVNVILVIDNSGSMQASDYYPTRLDAAKTAAKTLILQLSGKDLAGIVIFESGA
ncbi:MAG: VWA domain-containing protein, partial [Methanolinea sp.]|nr:VWA domain-containing protein [Methanolinea sp.]